MSETDDLMGGRAVSTNLAGFRTDIRAAGHAVIADEPIEHDHDPSAPGSTGTGEGASPTQLLLGALGSCTAITLRMYGERKGWDVGEVTVDCRLFYRGGDRKTPFIERTITLSGTLDDDHRARLLDIASRTPVTLLVRGETPVESTLTT